MIIEFFLLNSLYHFRPRSYVNVFFTLFIYLCNLIFHILTEKPLLKQINRLVHYAKYLVNHILQREACIYSSQYCTFNRSAKKCVPPIKIVGWN